MGEGGSAAAVAAREAPAVHFTCGRLLHETQSGAVGVDQNKAANCASPTHMPRRRSVPRPAPLLLGSLLETAVRDELTSQNLGAAPRFVMVGSCGGS